MLAPMSELIDRFRALHDSGCFVMPNPWDIGGARLLESMGFPALATTSSGFAWSRGRRDNHISLEEALAHFREMSGAVNVPINGDFEGGFAVDADSVHANVRAAAATGVAGLSIEDSTSDTANPLFDFDLALDRIRAARSAIDASGTGIVLTARCETFLVGRPNLDEAIRRLSAFAEAGADCLYAPGVRDVASLTAIVQAVAPTALNVLVGSDFTNVAELRAIGVRRISVGGALARAAWAGFLRSAREIADEGTFHSLADAVPFAEINDAFS
jgi:2-methylisocitrate lyase-like PEP mutase family enzyme